MRKPRRSSARARPARALAAGQPEGAALTLPDRLDAAAAAELRQTLLVQRGQPLEVRAQAVTRVTTPALQVLLSAARTWAADGHALRLSDPTPALQDAARSLGLSLDAFTAEGHPQ